MYYKVALDGTDTQTDYTGMYSCGTSDFDTCSFKQDSYFKTANEWGNIWGFVSSEVAQKETDIMGDSYTHAHFDLLKGENKNLVWDYRVWGDIPAQYCYFQENVSAPDSNGKNEDFHTWTTSPSHSY